MGEGGRGWGRCLWMDVAGGESGKITISKLNARDRERNRERQINGKRTNAA